MSRRQARRRARRQAATASSSSIPLSASNATAVASTARWLATSSHGNFTSSRCAGPFPFAFGSFTAIGRDAVAALVATAGFHDELSRLHTLIPARHAAAAASSQPPLDHRPLPRHEPPPSSSPSQPSPDQPLMTEDIWLGSALWRFVGDTMPIAIYSLSGEPTWSTHHPRYLYFCASNLLYSARTALPYALTNQCTPS